MEVEIRVMAPDEVETVDRSLPLDRLDQAGGDWLVAWAGEEALAHLHLDWTHDPPLVQNLFVAEAHRRRGVASELSTAAEQLVRARGHRRIGLDVDVENDGARALYETLGYRELGAPPRHERGTIMLRGKPFSYDVVLIDLVKDL